MENKYRLNKLGFRSKRVKELRKKRENILEPRRQNAGPKDVKEANPDWLKSFNEECANLGSLSMPQKPNMD